MIKIWRRALTLCDNVVLYVERRDAAPSMKERSALDRGSTLSSSGRKCHVERIVASRVHGTRIGQMERERLDRPRPCAIHSRLWSGVVLRACVYTREERREGKEEKRERERDVCVGGWVARTTSSWYARSSNNRILVRAASRRGCAPL